MKMGKERLKMSTNKEKNTKEKLYKIDYYKNINSLLPVEYKTFEKLEENRQYFLKKIDELIHQLTVDQLHFECLDSSIEIWISQYIDMLENERNAHAYLIQHIISKQQDSINEDTAKIEILDNYLLDINDKEEI